MSSSTSLEEGEIREEGEISGPLQGEATSSRPAGQRHASSGSTSSRRQGRRSRASSPSSEGELGEICEVAPPLRSRSEQQLEEQEMARLIDDVQYETRAVGLQDCIKDLSGVCRSLDRAMGRARSLYRLLHQRDTSVAGADTSIELGKAGVRILNGLRSLHVFSNTGQGRDMEAAQGVVRAAWRDRDLLFTAAQRKQLEGWLRSSRRLAALLPRDAGFYEPAQPSQPPKQQQQQQPAVSANAAPPPGPAVAAGSGTSAANSVQHATASLGDKRSLASDGDSARSAGAAGKRRRGGGPAVAAVQRLPPLPPGPEKAAEPPASSIDGELLDLAALAPPPPPPPPPPSPPPAPVQQASSLSIDKLADSEDVPPAAVNHADSPSHHAAHAASPFHGIAVSDDVRGLLGRGKLCLVLDLDHTLLNSARYAEVHPELQDRLERRCATEAELLPERDRLLFRMDEIKMWTKLRPGVRQFLETAAQTYELWIHTNGNKSYAAAVTKLLDPTGALFGERVIAQGAERLDEMQADMAKSFMQGLEGREAVTVIVDDSHSVWAQHRRNLVVVERYVYFPSSRLQLGIARPSLLEANRDECFEQGMLPTTLDVLLRVHRRVLDAVAAPPTTLPSGELVFPNWDVRHVLGEERQRVLRGVMLVFSRVFPLDRRPETHPLWQMAEAFGARCSTAMEPGVTHVVAAAGGTEKVMQARQRGLFVVTPGWLECSCILWKRAHEERFPVPL